MLTTRERLRRSTDFRTALRRGRRAGRGTLVVHLHSDHPSGVPGDAADAVSPRVGFVVPRSVGGAVVRNRVRRRLRHLVRDCLADVPCGSLVVVRALPPAAAAGYEDLAADLRAALTRVLAGSPKPSQDPDLIS